MDRSTVIDLISETYSQNNIGAVYVTEDYHQVYAQVESVNASEFFEGGRSGLNPELRFTVFAYDYNGEKILEYSGDRYFIYRVYKGKNDTLELYTERRQGNTVGHQIIQ